MKLVDIPVIFICPDNNTKFHKRKEHMIQLLNSIGFKSITHFKSGTEKYPTCLVKATLDILNSNINDDPLIILEDDIKPFLDLNIDTDIEFPEDTDAMYLGFSNCGGSKIKNINEGPSIIEKYSDKYIRILNMLSGHAILYKSSNYKQQVINCMNEIIKKPGYYNDVAMSRLHPLNRIYGYYYPLFYQSAKLGNTQHVENCTKITFNK